MIQTFIPYGDVPKTEMAGSPPLCWFTSDSEERYRRDPHPTLKPEDVIYRFNDYGYRCAPFSSRSEINVVFIGCSWIFGTGLPEEATAASIFCRLLEKQVGKTVTNWNLGFPAKSNDYIARTLLCAVPLLRPDLVVVNFTYAPRREYIPLDGEMMNLLPAFKTLHLVRDLVRRRLYKHLYALASEYEDQMNLFKNYKLVELVLEKHKTRWLFSANDLNDLEPIRDQLCRDIFLEPGLQITDRARDLGHPGIESNRRFATRIFEAYQRVYGTL